MIILLSPSKGQDFEQNPYVPHSYPQLLAHSEQLMTTLKKLKVSDVQQLMSVSENLAELNVDRFQAFKTPFMLGQAKQAALAFKGDVYTGLDADTWSDMDWAIAQKHIRILSGLYGYLRPLDLIQAYRLEMKTKLQHDKYENLYQFWGHQITDTINKECDDWVINLASNEYFKAVKKKGLKAQVLTINFKDTKDGKTRVIGFYAKKARGQMARAIIQNNVTSPDDIKGLSFDGYQFDDSLSEGLNWVFERQQPPPVNG
ncbi:peroxide stress protein YaaA [Marinicella rhabdoformis]|uniref:peroxide stress protein YaaA n=1 Tax=Marinicella rhabdoformis TaxID=2580566 RepID=UPI0012AEC3E1|nr:peroxide stress protein YaaA [Marinicella rhabdoformis]